MFLPCYLNTNVPFPVLLPLLLIAMISCSPLTTVAVVPPPPPPKLPLLIALNSLLWSCWLMNISPEETLARIPSRKLEPVTIPPSAKFYCEYKLAIVPKTDQIAINDEGNGKAEAPAAACAVVKA